MKRKIHPIEVYTGVLTLKNSIVAILFAVALISIGCGGGDNPGPKPEPPIVNPPDTTGNGGNGGNGGNNGNGGETDQFLGSYANHLKALELVSSQVGGDTTKALFGAAFWEKARWRIYPSAGNLTDGSLGSEFLNDAIVKDLLAAKPEDWEKITLSDGTAVWLYTAKDQAAFTVQSNSPIYKAWMWIVSDNWVRPTGPGGPAVVLALSKTDNPRDFRDICAWYQSNE